MRALAVGAVVLTHLGIIGRLESSGWLPSALVPLFHGTTGVQVFFVLSGFLITSLLLTELRNTGTISIRNFVIRRSLRIFPLYFLFLFIVTLLHLCGRNVANWEALGYAYCYCYNFIPKDQYVSLLGHTWSLAVEEHFYLVWPTVFLLFAARSRAALVLLLLTCIVGAPFLQVLLIDLGFGQDYFVGRWSFVAGSSIALGCLAAILINGIGNVEAVRRWARSRACLALGALLFADSLLVSGDAGLGMRLAVSHLRVVGITLIIMWIFCNPSTLMVRILELRPLRYLGLISYGIYIFQGLFLDTGPVRNPSQSWPPPPWLGFILLVITAPLSYRYFEIPFLRIKDRFRSVR